MPKEQPCLSEHSLCAASSKNVKDKSNSTTLLVIRNAKDADNSSGRDSRCSSEKDSGYSDGSDWQQTDVEDQRSNTSQSRGSKRAETSRPGQNEELGAAAGNPTLMPAGLELSPTYIINNMVLKQPDMNQKSSQLPWRNGSVEAGSSGAAHVILLQQPNLLLATLELQRSSSQKSTGKKINGTYRPILNSYPRIAPHPGKKPPDKSSLNDESQNLCKRVCTEHKNDDTLVTRSLPEQHLYKQPKLAVLSPGPSCSSSTGHGLSSTTTVSSSQGSPSGSNLHTTSSFLSTTSTRHRRFLNTVGILRQSGLLDKALRTKELLRQSSTTERDIAQIRQHTELLCQAASSPSCSLKGIAAWEHLHRSMAESGSYPNLKVLQNLQIPCHPGAASQPESISTGDTNGSPAAENSEVPLSHRLTTIPGSKSHTGKGREHVAGYKSSKKVTIMPPDTSTS